MTLKNKQKELANKLGRLLALSPLNNDLIKILLSNIGKMPEPALAKLLMILEKEQAELQEISLDIKLFLKEQNKNWERLENDQKLHANKFVEEKLKNLVNNSQ